MIAKIKNRHLRRLAIIGFFFVGIAAMPFLAIAVFAPEYLSDLWHVTCKLWNKPNV